MTARFLRELGHDVITVAELGMSRASDTDLLARAGGEGRVWSLETRTSAVWSSWRGWEKVSSSCESLRPCFGRRCTIDPEISFISHASSHPTSF
ncbi:MAG TPA: hypothetical protein VFA77_13355 [Candidatus Eisenbacteria bacterium]|nr:hypothetical protein [Candidatus Eisenbacteria bacterium]